MPLYLVYAVVQGASSQEDIWPLRVHSFGSIELLTRTPMTIQAGLAMDLVRFVVTTVAFCSDYVLHR